MCPPIRDLSAPLINTRIFPYDLKLAKVTLIYNSGDKTECGNYLPISVISAVAKVFEKLVYRIKRVP